MSKSIRVITKQRRGRPVTTGKGTLVGVRLLDEPLSSLDSWIVKQNEPDLTRPEAIRRLIEIGLATSNALSRPTVAKGAARAAELAASVIEKHIDASAPAEEREARKRRLLKGPSAFREVRVDRAKAKK